MVTKTFTFVAGMDGGIPVAICLEHDLVTQANTMDELPAACEAMLEATVASAREDGLDPWALAPPPAEAVAEVRALPDARAFIVTMRVE